MEKQSSQAHRSEEDQIIELLSIEGSGNLFEDTDFIPNRQSLYDNEGFIPYYDTEVTNFITWKRPHEFCNFPCYFHETFDVPSIVQGTLLDEAFIGVLAAVAVAEEGELIENIVYSRPDDFKQYGVFTCRFYVEGEWVEVITDTRIPCIHNEVTDKLAPIYSRSSNRKELWVSLIQKAYAKALGSYEAVSKVKVSDLLVHLTGGSVQEIRFHEEGGLAREFRSHFAKRLKKMISSGTVLVAKPLDSSDTTTGGHGADRGPDSDAMLHDLEGLMADKYYAVLALREVNISELVLLHCPWERREGAPEWEGDWSDGSAKWDEYPEVLQSVQDDPAIKWRRNDPKGFLWMSFGDFVRLFQGVHCCQLFHNTTALANYYFDKGDFRDRYAGGPMASIRDREEGARLALKTEHDSLLKATASVIVDGDSSWFNNPQYRLTSSTPARVTISLIPVSLGEEGAGGEDSQAGASLPLVQLTVCEPPRGTSPRAPFIGDALLCHVVATDRGDNAYRQKGQEACIWNLRVTENKSYFVIPSTSRRGQKCGYVLRIFSSSAITVERVPALHVQCKSGEWAKTAALDTTGGPPRVLSGSGEDFAPGSSSSTASAKKLLVDNSKWCQNSQFHLRLDSLPSDQEDVFLKIVLRRTDRSAPRHTVAVGGNGPDCFVGFVVCKPDMLEEHAASKSKLGKPRLNPFGDVISAKPSSLQKESTTSKNSAAKEQYLQDQKNSQDNKIARKLSIDPLYFSEITTYSHRTEACMYFPRVPRSWMPDGLLIIPSLSEKGARGSFDLEVYASKPTVLQQIKDQRCKSVAGDWVEGLAGGSHVCPTWKRNPRYDLSLKYPLNRGATAGSSNTKSCAVRISLTKSGSSWRSMCRSEAVACMIGFYVFAVTRSEGGEQLRQIYETDFAPTAEVCTEAGFHLDYLFSANESYVIMPTTFEDGKLGSFVLTVATDCDFTITRENPVAPHK